MDFPLVPMHEACESEHVPTSDDSDGSAVAEKPIPFAVLAALKTNNGYLAARLGYNRGLRVM